MSTHTLRRGSVAVGTLAAALLATLAAGPVQAGPAVTSLDGTESAGARSGVSLLDGTLLLRGDGSNVRLHLPEGARVHSFADLGDRVVVSGVWSRAPRVWTLSPTTGRVWRSEPSRQTELAGNGRHTAVAWLGTDGSVRVARSGRAAALTLPGPVAQGMQVVTAVEGADCSTSCAAYLDTDQGTFRTSTSGRPTLVRGFVGGVTASVGAFRTGYDSRKALPDGFPCSVVERRSDAARTWSGCQWAGWGIGPDGRYSHQRVNHVDGYGSPQVRFLGNASGTPYATVDSDRIETVAWEDGRHAIAAVELLGGEGRYAVYRLGVDGSAERVTRIRTTGSSASPWLLPAA